MNPLNKFIEAQLNKITLPIIQLEPNKLIFKRQSTGNNSEFNIGDVYNIEVENYIINPPPDFSLADNWNFGTVPPEKELSAKVLQVVGKMIKFSCTGKTSNITWEGWLPLKSIKII